MCETKQIYIDIDDDTYKYGGNTFECQYSKVIDTYLEPFILKKDNKVIKFYRSNKFFAIYKNDKLIKIIKVMTCWSEDYIILKINDGIAYNITQTAKGRFISLEQPCNIDYSDFIREYDL